MSMMNPYDRAIGRKEPGCEGNVGSHRVCKTEEVGASPSSFDPYSYLFTGINAMTSRAATEFGPQAQDKLNQAQATTQQATQQTQQAQAQASAQTEARIEASKARIKRLERQERIEKQGVFQRIKCFLFGGEEC